MNCQILHEKLIMSTIKIRCEYIVCRENDRFVPV
jgi:hypothetical protein